VGCFVVVQVSGGFFQVSFDSHVHFELRLDGGGVYATFVLRDKKCCALGLGGEHRLHDAPSRHELGITVSKLRCVDEALWVEPFPGAARAVICLTDHPDWDSVPKIKALGELFSRHNIRITKGVFPVADIGWSHYGPGLNVPAYAAQVDQWSEMGHEIAFHGLGSRCEVSDLGLEECLRRMDSLQRYDPKTWIDHGGGEYIFARLARLPGDADLVEELRRRGVRNFWSYGDPWQNPSTHLHIWHHRSVPGAFGDFVGLAHRRGLMPPMQFAYLGTVPLKNIGGDAQYLRLCRRPWSPSEWKLSAHNFKLLREINADPLYLYDLNGDFVLKDPDATLVFDTVLLNHLALQLCPANVDRLVACGGILIAHVYCGAVPRYGGRNCFDIRSEARLLDGFQDNIVHISHVQEHGDLVTLPLRDLRQALTNHAASRTLRREDGWEVHAEAVVCSRSPYMLSGTEMTRDRNGVFSATVRGFARLLRPMKPYHNRQTGRSRDDAAKESSRGSWH
jgi:hypothetical protein